MKVPQARGEMFLRARLAMHQGDDVRLEASSIFDEAWLVSMRREVHFFRCPCGRKPDYLSALVCQFDRSRSHSDVRQVPQSSARRAFVLESCQDDTVSRVRKQLLGVLDGRTTSEHTRSRDDDLGARLGAVCEYPSLALAGHLGEGIPGDFELSELPIDRIDLPDHPIDEHRH